MIDTHERIRRRAHEIWESEGRPHGRHEDHWSRAERELHAEGGTATAPTGQAGQAGQTTRKSKERTDAAPAPAKAGKPAKPAAKSPRAGRKETQADGRKGAAPH